MRYILDIIIAAAVVICIAHGFGKGAVRMIISSVGCIAALAAAVFVSGAADEYVYESFVRPSVLSVLEKKADELSEKYFSEEYFGKILSQNGIKPDGEQSSELSSVPEEFYEVLTNEDFRAKLNSVFISYCQSLTDAFSGILPEEVLDGAGSYINELESENERKLEMLTFDKKSAAELVEREMIRPIIMRVVRTALFVVTFAVVSGVFTVISYAARAARGIRAVRSADDILGGIIGCLQGIVAAAVLCAVSFVFINITSDGNRYLNSGTISETILFKRLYSGTVFLLSLILK